MELINLPEAFQSKLRLMIISALTTGNKTFKDLKEITQATDGNLSVQITKLETDGFVEVKKEFVGRKTQTTVLLTDKGLTAFKEYVALLNSIIQG